MSSFLLAESLNGLLFEVIDFFHDLLILCIVELFTVHSEHLVVLDVIQGFLGAQEGCHQESKQWICHELLLLLLGVLVHHGSNFIEADVLSI